MNRVAVTGMGAWCSTGRTLEEFCASLRAGVSGRREIPHARFSTAAACYRTRHGATLIGIDSLDELAVHDQTLLADLAITVATDALSDAGLSEATLNESTVGVCLGTSVGGTYALMKYLKGRWELPGGDAAALLGPCTSGSLAGTLAYELRADGPVSTISTACAAGTNSVGRAFDWIRHGRADYVLAGGVDLFSELTFSGFNSLQALAKGPCRPFDEHRDGLMLGDAGAILVLEPLGEALGRGARVYCEVAGYAIANEAFHPTGPDPQGKGAAAVMRGALQQAHLQPNEIDHIEAHGTGTRANDAMEIAAIRSVFAEHASRVSISSVKSMIGHCLGAAGSIELVATILGMQGDFIPPTLNLEERMQGSDDLNISRPTAATSRVNAALSNSFGFGGNVAAIAVRRLDQQLLG